MCYLYKSEELLLMALQPDKKMNVLWSFIVIAEHFFLLRMFFYHFIENECDVLQTSAAFLSCSVLLNGVLSVMCMWKYKKVYY
jgi:hypothetical protein